MSLFRPQPMFGKAAVALAGVAVVVPAHAQTLGLAPSHDVSLWRVVAALVFCCVLGAAGAFALKYRMRTGTTAVRARTAPDWRQLVAGLGLGARVTEDAAGRLKLIETVRLGYQVEVNLLECDGKSIVIVASPHGAFIAGANAPDKAGEPS